MMRPERLSFALAAARLRAYWRNSLPRNGIPCRNFISSSAVVSTIRKTLEFVNLEAMDYVGVYPDYDTAEEAWRAAAQKTVDDAEMKYVIVHLHRLLQPDMLAR